MSVLPTSKNYLKINLQTWHEDLLILLKVKDSTATQGLAPILEEFDDHYQVVQ